MERKGSNNANPEELLSAPTSTTKALLIHIVAPRKFAPEAIVVEDPKEDDNKTKDTTTEAAEDDDNNNDDDAPLKEDVEKTASATVDDSNHTSTSSNMSTTSSKNSNNAPLKFIQSLMAGSDTKKEEEEENSTSKIDGVDQTNVDDSNNLTVTNDNNNGDENNNNNPLTSSDGTTKITAIDDDNDNDDQEVVTENETKESQKDDNDKEERETKEDKKKGEEEEEEEEVTPEEAAAVTVGDDPQDTEINVEELLRIAFSNLLQDYLLLNAPTYTYIYCNNSSKSSSITKKEPSSSTIPSWIQVQVMVRPSSIDEIFNRLERIGIGSDVGTVSMYKAELCRTASPFALVPHEEDEGEEEKQESDGDSKEEDKEAGSVKKEANAKAAAPAIVVPVTKVAAPPSVASGTASTNPSIRSKVSIVPGGGDNQLPSSANSSTHKSRSLQQNKAAIEGGDDEELSAKNKEQKTLNSRAIEAAKAEWMNAATRLRIEQVREQIVEQAAFSFDFISLLSIASILAGVGLITDNTVVIVASMLVSPIMGPVLGMTFGGRIQDWPLVKTSLLNEALALLVAIVIGAIIGLSAAFVDIAESWPTNEMQIRGEPTGLYTGIAIAIPSGMGVCLSILGNNTGSLVGVAISASLLPPAVNTGICCAFAVLLKLNAIDEPDSYTAGDFAVIGGISFGLTALNIVCIWIAGSLMFVIKEVAPTEQKSNFWKRDIKVARKLNEDVSGRNTDPRPVDISLIKQGIETALEKRHHHHMASGRHLSEGELSIGSLGGRGRRNRTSSSGALMIGPQLPNRPTATSPTLESAMALHSQHHPEKQKPNQGIMSIFSSFWGHPQSDDEASDEEAIVDAVDENVRYVGLEHMSALLGFDDEEDYDIDHDAVVRKIGHGRYL